MRYQDACLRNARMALRSSPWWTTRARAWSSITAVAKPSVRDGGVGRPANTLEQVTEQPRAPEAAPTDDDAVAAGGRDHGDGVGGLPDVAVAEHGDRRHVRLELGDGLPAGVAGVVLLDRAGVHGDGDDPLVGADLAGAQVRDEPVVEPDAELRRDRHAVRRGGRDRGTDDGPQQARLGRDGGATALARDLGRRAPEVEVDVVDQAASAHPVHGPPIITGSEP